jgi:hypothetical protein
MHDAHAHPRETTPTDSADHAGAPDATAAEQPAPDQAWYWTGPWQRGEAEATAQIAAGGLPVYDEMASLFAEIDTAADSAEDAGPGYAVDPYGPAPLSAATFGALNAEVARAIAKHGLAHSPLNPATAAGECLAMLVEEVGEVAHTLTYDADPADLDEELVQVAAVAGMWLQARIVARSAAQAVRGVTHWPAPGRPGSTLCSAGMLLSELFAARAARVTCPQCVQLLASDEATRARAVRGLLSARIIQRAPRVHAIRHDLDSVTYCGATDGGGTFTDHLVTCPACRAALDTTPDGGAC